MKYLTFLKQSFSSLKQLRYLSLSFLLDVIFFYALARLHLEVFTVIGERLVAVTDIIEQKTAELTALTAPSSLDSFLLQTPEFTQHYETIILYLILFLVGTFGVFALCQGLNWFFAHRLAGVKVSLWRYLGRFFWHSFLSFVLVIMVLVIFVSVVDLGSLFPLLGETSSAILLGVLVFLVGHVMLVSIVRKKFWSSFPAAFRQVPALIFHAAYVLLLILAGVLGAFLVTLHWSVLTAFVIVILLPSITLFRVFMVKVIMSNESRRKSSEKSIEKD